MPETSPPLQRMAGHAWAPRSGLPMLLAAVHGRWRHPGLSGRIRHPCWVLDYCFAPAGLSRVGGPARPWNERPARVGHLYAPGCTYWEDTRAVGCRIHGTYVTFLGGEATGLGALTADHRGYARILDPDGKLGCRLQQIAEVGQARGEAGFWTAHAVFYELIDLLLLAERTGEKSWRLGSAPSASVETTLAAAVRTYLAEHLTEPVALAEIAAHLGVSVSTLSHRYREDTGETPMATRTRLVLNAAKSLLLKGAALKQVAAETGFCDVYHLSKAFKRGEGLSPRAWLGSFASAGTASSV